jgi:hypothetical protein
MANKTHTQTEARPTDTQTLTVSFLKETGSLIPEMSRTDFVREIVATKGARFATIIATTTARVKKTSNDGTTTNPNFKDTVKTAKASVIINHNYTNSVNNQRNREEDNPDEFTAVERRWGSRIAGTSFVEHKGTLYLETKVEGSLGYQYFVESTGEHLDADAVHSFITPRKESARQMVDNPVVLRDYKVDNIDFATFNGQTVRLVGPAPSTV